MIANGFQDRAVTQRRAPVSRQGAQSISLRRGWFGALTWRPTRGRVAVFGLLACLLWAAGCSRQTPVRNPQPLVAAPSPELTEQAILDVLPRRRWTAEQVEPGRVVAFLPIKTHLLRVAIMYDAQQVQIAYLSSDNLNERPGPDGETYAHPYVNKWMQRLAADISRALARQARVALVPPPMAAPAPAPAPEGYPPPEGYAPPEGAPPPEGYPAQAGEPAPPPAPQQ